MIQVDPISCSISRHFARPLRGGAVAVLAVFAILLSLSARSIFGAPLALILNSWFFKYAFILFDHTLRGFDEPPVLDIQMMNPLSEQRPLAAMIIVCGMGALCWITYSKVGPTSGWVAGCTLLLLLPAMIAVLGLEGNILKAVDPRELLKLILGLGIYYWLTIGVIAAELLAIYLLSKVPLALVLQLAVAMFGALSAFSLLAGALYERRDQLGLYAWKSPERLEENQRREDHRQDEKVVAEAYGLSRSARHVESWQVLGNWLEAQQHRPNAYAWLTEQVDSWDDPRYGRRLAEDHVARLQVLKKPGDALKVVNERLRHDPAFRPKSADDTLQLAQLAVRGGGSRATARTLLADFPQRFAGDPRTPVAAQLLAQLQ